MADVIDPAWGNPGAPGSAQERKWKRENLTTITLNCGVRLTVNKLCASLFKGFWDELEAETGYSLADQGVPDDWGFANRPNRNNPNSPSRHSRGLAVDGNAEENPNTHDGQLHTNMPIAAVRRLCKKHGLRWGGDYKGATKDTMHVEVTGSPDDVRALVLRLAATPTFPSATPAADEHLEDDMFYVIGYSGGAGRWLYFPQTGTKALIVDGAALAEAQKSKGYGGYLEMLQEDLRAIPYPDKNKSPAA